MGKSLFNLLYSLDRKVVWVNRSNHISEKKKYERKLERSKKNQLITDAEYSVKKKNVIITDDLNYLTDCDIVIETITEELDLKNNLFQKLETILKPTAIMVSNSSSILPERFNLSESSKSRFAGLHFFYPAQTNKMVEIIRCSKTTNDTLEKIKRFCALIDKKFFIQDARSGFFINRFFLEIQAGLFNYCIANDISFPGADRRIKENVFPIGIFEMMDAIGANILYYAISNYNKYYSFINSPLPLMKHLEKHLVNEQESGKSPVFKQVNKDELTAEKEEAFNNFLNSLIKETAHHYMDKYNLGQEEMSFIVSEYTNSDLNQLFLH